MTEQGKKSGVGLASGRRRLVAAVALTIVAAVPRFYDLGHLSFYSDEDLTALAAQAVVQGEGPAMPSGMAYHRAIPFTWMNAGAVAILGDEEASYRATAALFGTLTPAAVLLTGSAFVSPPAALVGAATLALSEWHVAFSRFARMYSPFLFFFVLAGFFFWRWSREGGLVNVVLALIFFAITTSLHILGLFAVQFALIPLFLRGRRGPPAPLVLLVALGAAYAAFDLDGRIVGSAYAPFRNLPDGFALDGAAPPGSGAGEPEGSALGTLLLLAGVIAGGWLGWPKWRSAMESAGPVVDRVLVPVGILGSGMVAGAFLGAGHLWGATLATSVLLLIQREPLFDFLRERWMPLALFAAGGIAWTAYSVGTLGLSDGISRVATFPFPYLAFFWSQFPGLVVLFLGAVAWMLLSPDRADRPGLLCILLGVLMPMAAIGMVSEWGGTRYLFHLYPYMILGAAALLVHAFDRLGNVAWPGHRQVVAPVAAIVVVLLGATGGHGLAATARVATLDHGEPVNEYIHIFALRPDHRGPGEYVRGVLEPGDVVITEHPSTQIIYAGKVDYWFRRAGDARAFVYLDDEGTPREIYAGAIPLTTPDQMEAVVDEAPGNVWLITSGETALLRDWYLSEEQRAWLESIEERVAPAFVGEDGYSRVFCLNCQAR